MNKKQTLLCESIFDYYGKENQIKKTKEELKELYSIIDDGYEDNIMDEIADCLVMLTQLKYHFGYDRINERINYKLNRQLERMEKES